MEYIIGIAVGFIVGTLLGLVIASIAKIKYNRNKEKELILNFISYVKKVKDPDENIDLTTYLEEYSEII